MIVNTLLIAVLLLAFHNITEAILGVRHPPLLTALWVRPGSLTVMKIVIQIQAYRHGIETAAHGWNLMVLFLPGHPAHRVGWQDFCYGIGLAGSVSN